MDPHKIADKALSWITSILLIVLFGLWASRLIYRFFDYLWR